VRLDDALPHDTLPQLRDRALIIFLLSMGCRISEALTLDRSDWQREQVVVIGKRRKERVAIISPRALVPAANRGRCRSPPGAPVRARASPGSNRTEAPGPKPS
jgi:integrase